MLRRDLTGRRFVRLLVIRYEIRRPISAWVCKCDCGVTKEIAAGNLVNGRTTSCGCLFRETKWAQTHGLAHTPIHNVWATMKARCSNPKHNSFHTYGGRGIKVCDRWLKFENFYEDMGASYTKGLTIDRIDNNKGYYKENCRWATQEEQQNNRSDNHLITHKGRTMTLSRWAREIGLQPGVLSLRVRRKWDIERALTTPLLRLRHK